jgi:GDP-fucose transporter C1
VQVARSLTVVFNVALTYLVLGERTSRNTLVALGVVVGGFWMGVDSEARFSFLGTLFGVTSSLFVSLNSIVTKTASEAVNRNKWRLSAYNNTLAAILFLPLIIVTGEVDVILDGAAFFFSFWCARCCVRMCVRACACVCVCVWL